jgi:hypothetical protein
MERRDKWKISEMIDILLGKKQDKFLSYLPFLGTYPTEGGISS